VKISELFKIEYGINMELNKCEITTNDVGINFVSRTGQNNGITAKVMPVKGKIPQPAGVLTCASGGSVLSTYVQIKPFYSGRDLYVLTPLKKMSLNEKLYYCMCIKNNAYRYAYGRQANKTLKDIELPDNIPELVYTTNIDYNKISTNILKNDLKMSTDNWKEFEIGGKNGLFRIENCKCSNAGKLEKGNELFYIGAKKDDNGIMNTVKYDKKLRTKGNCIVFICDGEGSVGYSNYRDKDFIGSTTLSVGYNDNLNKYNGIFLVTVLDLERPKYSFGRKYRKSLPTTTIKLPSTSNGNVDWNYMENYIKSLPNSDRI